MPAGVIAGAVTLVAYELARHQTDLSEPETRSLATITLLGIGLVVLIVASRPLHVWKIGLAGGMAGGYAVLMAVPFTRHFFELDLFAGPGLALVVGAIAVAGSGIVLIAPTDH